MTRVLAVLQTVCQVALTGAGAAALAAALHLLNVGVELRLAWWMVAPFTPVLYAAIVFTWAPDQAGRRALLALGGLWAAHAYVGAVVALLLVLLEDLVPGAALRLAFWQFAPAVPLELLAALLMFRPFRHLLAPPPRVAPRADPTPVLEPVRTRAAAAVFGAHAPAPRRAPSPRRPVAAAATATAPATIEHAPRAEHTPRVAAPAVTVAANPTPAPVASPRDVPCGVDDEAVDGLLRIPFGKVAEQLPPDAFALPLDSVAARLEQPGELVVPRRLVVRQLGDGIVTVPWDAVEAQFPADVLVARNGDMAARIAGGRLVLPLEEVVRQLPLEVFKRAPRRPDIPDIDSFPLPFQPPSTSPPAPATTEPPPLPAKPRPATAPSPAIAAPSPALADPSPVVAEYPVALADLVPVAAEPSPREVEAAAHAVALLLPPAPTPVGEPARPPGPSPAASGAEGARLPSPSAPDTRSPRVDRSPALDGPRPLRAALARLTGLPVDVVRDAELTVFCAASPGEPSEALADIARRLRPFLDAGIRDAPLDQLTLRTGSAAIVLTRLDAAAGTPCVLAAGTRRGAALACLEQSSRRGAVADVPVPLPVAAGVVAQLPPVDVTPAILPPEVERLAASLVALGTPAAASFRRRTPPLELYVFAGRDVESSALARFTAGLCTALEADTDDASTAWTSITGRRGDELVIVERVAATLAGPRVLVAAGTSERPGRARLELERAARVLGTGRS